MLVISIEVGQSSKVYIYMNLTSSLLPSFPLHNQVLFLCLLPLNQIRGLFGTKVSMHFFNVFIYLLFFLVGSPNVCFTLVSPLRTCEDSLRLYAVITLVTHHQPLETTRNVQVGI